jgi:hypothetical protein
VCWIETQDFKLFFEQYKFKRFIEVDPSLTLAGRATRTLKAKYKWQYQQIFYYSHVTCYWWKDTLWLQYFKCKISSLQEWSLGPQCADAVLLIATTMEPAKRLGSEAEGKAWLDAAAQVCAQRVGISLSSGGGGSSAGGFSGGAVMNSEEFLKFQPSSMNLRISKLTFTPAT